MKNKVRWVQRLAAAALGGGASLVIAACYGVYECVQKTVATGRVTYQHQGIPGIQVCVEPNQSCVRTDGNGYYQVSLCQDSATAQPGATVGLTFEDVDGPANGGEFQTQRTEITVTEDSPPLVNAEMVPVVE